MEAEEEKAGPGLLIPEAPGEQVVLRPLNKGAMEGDLTLEDKHNFCEAGDRGPRAQGFSYIGRGLSPALTPFPSGPKAPLASDLEFIQDNSLLLPPVSPLLPWGSQHSRDSQALLPSAQTPREGRSSWKWEFLRESLLVPVPDLCSWMRPPQRDHTPSCPSQEKAEEQGTQDNGGKGRSSPSSQGGIESRAVRC